MAWKWVRIKVKLIQNEWGKNFKYTDVQNSDQKSIDIYQIYQIFRVFETYHEEKTRKPENLK